RLQSRDVVVVVLDRLEGEERDELRRVDVDAVDLRDRDLPVLEARVFELLAERADEERPRERLLVRKAGRIDRLEPAEVLLRLREPGLDLRLREVGPLVVPPLVAQDRRELRVVGERVLPVVGEQVLHRLAPGLEVPGRRRGQRQAGCHEKACHSGSSEHAHAPSRNVFIRLGARKVRPARAGREWCRERYFFLLLFDSALLLRLMSAPCARLYVWMSLNFPELSRTA